MHLFSNRTGNRPAGVRSKFTIFKFRNRSKKNAVAQLAVPEDLSLVDYPVTPQRQPAPLCSSGSKETERKIAKSPKKNESSLRKRLRNYLMPKRRQKVSEVDNFESGYGKQMNVVNMYSHINRSQVYITTHSQHLIFREYLILRIFSTIFLLLFCSSV